MEESQENSTDNASGPVAAKPKRKPRAKKVVVETPVEPEAAEPEQLPDQPPEQVLVQGRKRGAVVEPVPGLLGPGGQTAQSLWGFLRQSDLSSPAPEALR